MNSLVFRRILFPMIAVVLAWASTTSLQAEDPDPTAPADEQAEPEMITIDFEGLPGSLIVFDRAPVEASFLSRQFAHSHGVVFSSALPYVIVIDMGPRHATSGVKGIGAALGDRLTFNEASPITITFVYPSDGSSQGVTDFVSIRGDLKGDSGESPTLSAYGIDGRVIEEVSRPDINGQTWSISAPGIHSVRFSGVHRTDAMAGGVGLDDLQFHPVTLPPSNDENEPSAGGP